jgi:hypothetical protein
METKALRRVRVEFRAAAAVPIVRTSFAVSVRRRVLLR